MKVVLEGQSSDFLALNSGVLQGSVLDPTLFLIFINDLPDNITFSLIDVFADDITLYSISSKSQNFHAMTTNLTSDLSSIADWSKKWLIYFNASKTKTIIFHHHKSFAASPIIMDDTHLHDIDLLNHLLGLTLTSDLKWGSYITTIAKNASNMVGSFYQILKISYTCFYLVSIQNPDSD